MSFTLISNVQAKDVSFYSDYYYMIDMDNNQVVFDHGSNEEIYPASMTKIMTLIVALENIQDLQQKVILDKDVFAGLIEENASMAGYSLNESSTLEDCIYGLFLPSGAEASRVIASTVAGSESGFVELMNKKAEELGLEKTHYVNTTGLHDNMHVTTLRDVATLLTYCLQNPDFKKIFTTHQYTADSPSMHKYGLTWKSNLSKSLDQLNMEGKEVIIGGKTGYTIPAGLCLASIAEKDDRHYMLITAHAPAGSTPYHVIDAINTYNTVFNDYKKSEWINIDEILGTSDLRFSFDDDKIDFKVSETVELTMPSEIEIETITRNLIVLEQYEAPIVKGDILGELQLLSKDEVIFSTQLVAQKDYDRSFILYGLFCMKVWMLDNLVYTGVILFVIGFIIWRIFVYRYDIKNSLSTKKIKKRRRY